MATNWFAVYGRHERLGQALAVAARALLEHRECPALSPEALDLRQALAAWNLRADREASRAALAPRAKERT